MIKSLFIDIMINIIKYFSVNQRFHKKFDNRFKKKIKQLRTYFEMEYSEEMNYQYEIYRAYIRMIQFEKYIKMYIEYLDNENEYEYIIKYIYSKNSKL